MTLKPKRCAIYTRKSSEEGLEQEFNSLHAQREACEAFVTSQKHEGWQVIKAVYDDGGISGGTMERPALQRLLTDIKNRKVDIIVVYKVDRLTRSLADFAKMVEIFDVTGVSFVSVTQQFNTTSSMGRLTLNVLLSFAQFEREVTGERIRDKIGASKMKGIFMGGNVPLGYEVKERKLLIKPKEAQIIRDIYQRYLELESVRVLQKEVAAKGICSAAGHIIGRSSLYKILSNPIYIGKIRHKNVLYPGQHQAIIDQALWDRVQQNLASNRNGLKKRSTKIGPSPLAGKLFSHSGEKLIPVQAKKQDRRYRYYVSQSLTTGIKADATNSWRLPAQELEKTVMQAAQSILKDHESIATAFQENEIETQYLPLALKSAANIDGNIALEKFVDRVELKPDGICLTLSLAALIPAVDTKIKITRDIPMIMKRRGVEMRMIIGGSPARLDSKLIKTIVCAHKWFNELASGQVKNVAEIASREGADKSYVNRIISLAFLSPKITEEIIAGQQSANFSVEMLTKHTKLPIEWGEQRKALDDK